MNDNNQCPVCYSEAKKYPDYRRDLVFYICPICGRFELGYLSKKADINYNHLASYLFYNRILPNSKSNARYHTILSKEKCDEYNADMQRTHGHPIHMDSEIIEAWYPHTFAERVDKILLYLDSHIQHVGQKIAFNKQETLSLLFIDRQDIKGIEKRELRNETDFEEEINFMLSYLSDSCYVDYNNVENENEYIKIGLTPHGYSRVDEIQKNTSHGRNVLIAMKFGDDTIPLREAIRKGIQDAGYHAVFIDEVQHNAFITPELLKYIRDSKFVVVDLTHKNNGAYFEEGYAMGLGKPVIQLCRKGTRLHFDIAQKNTIMWACEDDIPERLTNRIKATID